MQARSVPSVLPKALLGVRLEARGKRLHVDAPKGALTPELLEVLRAHKAEILAVLGATTGPKRSATVIPFAPRRVTVSCGRTAEGAEIRSIVEYSYAQMREDGMACCDWCSKCKRNGGRCRRADLGDRGASLR